MQLDHVAHRVPRLLIVACEASAQAGAEIVEEPDPEPLHDQLVLPSLGPVPDMIHDGGHGRFHRVQVVTHHLVAGDRSKRLGAKLGLSVT